jgi:membrane-associated phospholipid phosphatase
LFERVWLKITRAIASERTRNYRAWLFQAFILVVLLAFSALAFFASVTSYSLIDLEITRLIQANIPGWFGVVLQAVSWPGYFLPSISVVALAVILLSMAGLRWEAVSVLFAALCAGALNSLVKIAIRRPRPSADLVRVFQELNSYSFPSGHVMFYTAFFGFLLFLTFILLKKSTQRSLLLVFLTSLVLLVGVSRMYLGEHWASDVLGGYLLGTLTLILAIQFYRQGKQMFSSDQPVAPVENQDEI